MDVASRAKSQSPELSQTVRYLTPGFMFCLHHCIYKNTAGIAQSLYGGVSAYTIPISIYIEESRPEYRRYR